MFMLFALSVVTAGLGVYYRDSCTNSYGCLGHSGLILYVECGKTLCPVNHTAVDLRQCSNDSGPANGSDTWLDHGCSLLGGGCTRRFLKSKGDKPWCVPVGLDKDGHYAPMARVGSELCRIQCGQDYGILDRNGNLSCACPPEPPSNNSAVDEACQSYREEMDVETMSNCFCQSPLSCNATSCPCIPRQGAMTKTIDLQNGNIDLRAAYPFTGLFPVVPCKMREDGNEVQCPSNWQQKKVSGYGALALAQGYRFLRPSSNMFYQPTGLAVSALRLNSCVCVRHCLSEFPVILCLLPKWSRKLVQCIPSAYLERTADLRGEILLVGEEDRKTSAIATVNGMNWTCWNSSGHSCQIAAPRPLSEAPVCVCLRPCTPSQCACGSHGFRVFKHFDVAMMRHGLCTLSGSVSGSAWKATVCKKGSTPCAAGEQIKTLETPEQSLFALGYRYFLADKWLRALPVQRPLKHGECLCTDRCTEGAPFLQCRLANETFSECKTPVEFPRGIGEGIVLAKDVPKLSCQGEVTVTRCNEISCNDIGCNVK